MSSESPDQAAFCHFIIGLCYYLSENVPYCEVKTQFKYALTLLRLKQEPNHQLRAALLHNLAVINYCELNDHNERIINGENTNDQEMLDILNENERQKLQKQQEERKIREEVDKQSRIKRFRERQHSLNDRLKTQLSTLKKDYKFSKNPSSNKIEKAIADRMIRKI